MANPSLQIGNDNWAIKEDNLLGYSTAGTRFVPQPITMTRATSGTRVNPQGLVETVELLGSEEITNGDFATDLSGWDLQGTNATNTITWETNGARIISTGVNIGMAQTSVLTIGKTYKLTCDVNITLGKIGLDGATSGLTVNMVEGFNEIIFTAISTTFKIKRITGNDNCLLDNVSVKEATIDNLPRVDYTDGTSSLLVEPQRTNVFIQNDISTWNGFSSYADETTAPDGTTIDFVNMEDRRIFPTTTISNSTEYTSSIYLKGNKTANVKLRNTAANDTVITLSTEWQRFELTATSVSTITNALLIDARYGQGMGAAGLEIAIYGGQVEQGSYPTSYIPTSGSTVTRNQDQYSKTGISNLINSEEGVLFLEMAALSDDLTNRVISLNDGTATNRLMLYFNSLSNTIAVVITSGGSTINYAVSDETSFNKMAVRYRDNDLTLWVDGQSRGTPITSATIPTFTALKFDSGGGSSPFYGKVKQLQVFKTALSDSELATLTT